MCLRREQFLSKVQNDHRHFISVRHYFFLNRVTEHWNKLTNSQIHAVHLNSFKARIDNPPETAEIAYIAQLASPTHATFLLLILLLLLRRK